MRQALSILFCSILMVSSGQCQEPAERGDPATDRRAELLKRFPEIDTNGDKVLSARELATHLKKMRSGAEAKSRLKVILKRFPGADANKDGELTWTEWREFQAANRRNNSQPFRRSNASRVKAAVPDVAYGDHDLQRFDLWPVPDAKKPTPLVVFIHGGGFRSGDKSLVRRETIETYQKAGIAFASLNYRLSDSGPYPIMMHDAARGLQTIRHRAKEWNIDPKRIVCYGGSAGAGISLWLAFHDDLADPSSEDPIARQSTRILAAGAMNGQSTYDMHTFREWFGVPDLEMGPALPAFLGIKSNADLDKPAVRALMKDASPITHLSKDDRASVYMTYSRPNSKVTKESNSAVWVHHVLLGLKLREAMQDQDLECIVTAPGIAPENTTFNSLEAFLIAKLKGAKTGK